MDMKRVLKLRDDLGAPGMAALGLLAAGLLFLFAGVKPLEHRKAELETSLASLPAAGAAALDPAAKLSNFYAFFDKSEDASDWLAKLDTLAKGSGVELASGRYQLQDTGTPLARYELTLPLSGSYPQIRAFLDKALAQIPVLSLDQLSLHRKSAADPVVQADVKLSLYLMKPPGKAAPVAVPAAPAQVPQQVQP